MRLLVLGCLFVLFLYNLLHQSGYDPLLRPGQDGESTQARSSSSMYSTRKRNIIHHHHHHQIKLSLAIMSLGPLDDKAQIVRFTCYLRSVNTVIMMIFIIIITHIIIFENRQSWRDFRLDYSKFVGLQWPQLSMSWRWEDLSSSSSVFFAQQEG